MKAKTLLIILVLAIALGGAGLILRRKDASSWQDQPAPAGGKVLSFTLNDVANVTIQSQTEQVNLVNKGDLWRVQERDYPADFSRLSTLLQTLWDLKAVQDVPAGPSHFGQLELLEPGQSGTAGIGTRIDLKNAQGQRLAALVLGKNYLKQESGAPGEGFAAGRYVLPVDGRQAVALVSETFADATTKPGDWLDHAFVQINNISAVTLSGTGAGMNWKLQQPTESGTWQLAAAGPNEKLDSAKVPAFANSLGNPTFVDVEPPAAKPAALPTTITIETTDALTYVLKVGDLENDQYPRHRLLTANLAQTRKPEPNEKPEDKKRLDDAFTARKKQLEDTVTKAKQFESRTFLIPKFTLDPILKDRATHLAVATASPTPSTTPFPSAPLAPTAPEPPQVSRHHPASLPPPAKTHSHPQVEVNLKSLLRSRLK